MKTTGNNPPKLQVSLSTLSTLTAYLQFAEDYALVRGVNGVPAIKRDAAFDALSHALEVEAARFIKAYADMAGQKRIFDKKVRITNDIAQELAQEENDDAARSQR